MSHTYKKRYRRSRLISASCRCHGGCPYCLGNRMHSNEKRELSVNDQLSEYAKENELSGIYAEENVSGPHD